MAESPHRTGSDIPLLLATLKSLYRTQGLRYADVARSLGISLMTVKRYLAGQGLSMAVLEQLCQQAGISLIDLSELAVQQVPQREVQLSAEQEEALAEHHGLAVLLHLLIDGWTVQAIQLEFDIAEPVLVATLSYLDRLGFIDLMPGNKIRLKAVRGIKWSHNPRLKRSFNQHLKKYFTKDFDHPDVTWRYRLVKLSPASISHLETMFEEMARAADELARSDLAHASGPTRWHGVLLTTQPVDLSDLREPFFLAPPRQQPARNSKTDK